MTCSPLRRAGIFFTFAVAFPVFAMGCPKKQPPVVDAGEPTPPASSASVAELAPLTEDDAGDAGADAGAPPKKWTGPGANPNQTKIQACCRAMRAEAKTLGASPEAFQLNAVAGQCDIFAKQVGPAGNAPGAQSAPPGLAEREAPVRLPVLIGRRLRWNPGRGVSRRSREPSCAHLSAREVIEPVRLDGPLTAEALRRTSPRPDRTSPIRRNPGIARSLVATSA